ncbi:DUF1648 domain-containing protein [Microbacterium sp. BWT-B31]|uniref:DUF1648 domain-containing protein n=1 Tax=Microbacterium sp. BWT-B31 TaxID=3232072 RepID=UPI0035274878
MTRPADLVVRRFVLVALWAPAVLVAVGVAIQLALLPFAPSTIAVHWNAAGTADGFAPAWVQPLGTIAVGFGLPALIALTTLPGLRRGERGPTYRVLGATSAAVAALGTVMFTWTFAMQAGLDTAANAPTVWAALVASFAAGALAGVGAWFVQPAQDAPAEAAEPATALALPDGARALWLRSSATRPGAAVGVLTGVLALSTAAAVSWIGGAPAALAWLLTGVALALVVLAATTLAFHVRVDASGLRVDSVLGAPRFHVPLEDVASVACAHVNPMGEFGGWGLRLGAGRRFGVVLRAGEAIEVVRRSGKRFVVTVDDARTGAALLAALVERRAVGA